MENQNKISVIIPTYNREKLIERAIKSVQAQTYKNIEIIVIDDGSTDNTEEVIKGIGDKSIKYIKQDNAGACVARNRGIEEATGSLIAFLDSDDEWFSQKLEIQLNHLLSEKKEISVCNYSVEKEGISNIAIPKEHPDYFTIDELLDHNYITTGSILITRQFLNKIGYFDEKMPRYQDWEIVLRMARETDIPICKDVLLELHVQTESITKSTSKEKKYYALERMLKKNKDLYLKNKKAYAHICWSMGLYSLFLPNKRIDLLKTGATHNGLNIKRLLIYCFIRIGGEKIVMKKYARNH